MTTTTTIERICQAAIRTATRDGLLAMTMDNVAKEAGVSKGGVMYHFPSKEALLTATLTYYSELAERMLMQRIADDPEPRLRWARAMLGCLFPDPDSPVATPSSTDEDDISPEIMPRFMLAVLAAAVNNPGLFEPLRKLGTRMRDRLLSDPDDGLEQLMIWLAVDGLFLWQFVGMIDQNDPVYQQIGQALRARTIPGALPAKLTSRGTAAATSTTKGRRREP
jgi:AcrR family transcriptional regulator